MRPLIVLEVVTAAHNKVLASDELGIAGFFVKHSGLEPPGAANEDRIQLNSSHPDAFDRIYRTRRGVAAAGKRYRMLLRASWRVGSIDHFLVEPDEVRGIVSYVPDRVLLSRRNAQAVSGFQGRGFPCHVSLDGDVAADHEVGHCACLCAHGLLVRGQEAHEAQSDVVAGNGGLRVKVQAVLPADPAREPS